MCSSPGVSTDTSQKAWLLRRRAGGTPCCHPRQGTRALFPALPVGSRFWTHSVEQGFIVGSEHAEAVACVISLSFFLCSNAGNILLNVLIPPNMPCTRTGKNNVLIVCVPNPPVDEKNATSPVTMLIRVKTGEDADELHTILLEKKDG